MKITLFLTAATATVIHAGTPAPVVVESPPEVQWLVPTLDARLRYEFSDVEGFQNSNALTMRLRPGFKTSEWNGFSAFAHQLRSNPPPAASFRDSCAATVIDSGRTVGRSANGSMAESMMLPLRSMLSVNCMRPAFDSLSTPPTANELHSWKEGC